MLNDWVESRFDLPAPDLPDLRDEEPEVAASVLRQHWGLGERPIKNMVHLLESKGVRVYSLAENSVEVDAFALWHSKTPFVFLNTLKSAEHGRFDAAHELGTSFCTAIRGRKFRTRKNRPMPSPRRF